MIKSMMTAVFGTRFNRERKRIQPVVDQIHVQEQRLKDLSETDLKAQTSRFASCSRSAPAPSRRSSRRSARQSMGAPIRSSGMSWSVASTSWNGALRRK